MRVGSLHNYCPFPAIKPNTPPGGDYFKLSSPDLEERRWAVQWTTRTIENANHLEAGAVVLHCGAIDMDSRYLDVYRMFRQGSGDSQTFRDMLAIDLKIREQLKAPHLDALLFDFSPLLPYLQEGRLSVIELAPGTPSSVVQQAIAHIRALGEFSETAETSDFFP